VALLARLFSYWAKYGFWHWSYVGWSLLYAFRLPIVLTTYILVYLCFFRVIVGTHGELEDRRVNTISRLFKSDKYGVVIVYIIALLVRTYSIMESSEFRDSGSHGRLVLQVFLQCIFITSIFSYSTHGYYMRSSIHALCVGLLMITTVCANWWQSSYNYEFSFGWPNCGLVAPAVLFFYFHIRYGHSEDPWHQCAIFSSELMMLSLSLSETVLESRLRTGISDASGVIV